MRLSIAIIAAALALGSSPTPAQKETSKMSHAKGAFEVKLTPQSDEMPQKLGRMTIDKTFSGDLAGTSRGQMLFAMGETEGSGVYVAVEHVTAKLAGRDGSFSLYHRGLQTRGEQSLSILVVPDSGTGELAGIKGTMNITITEGKHFYDFEYELP